jgi:hypothetical protein
MRSSPTGGRCETVGVAAMELINFGVPGEYVEVLRVAFGITCFVETGTFSGRTANWASERFERVVKESEIYENKMEDIGIPRHFRWYIIPNTFGIRLI